MGEVKRGGEDLETRNTFSTSGLTTNPDPWNPVHPVSSESSSHPGTDTFQDTHWSGPILQNIFRDRRQHSPRPQPPTRSTALIEHMRDLNITVTANYDDKLSMEARSILEDILF